MVNASDSDAAAAAAAENNKHSTSPFVAHTEKSFPPFEYASIFDTDKSFGDWRDDIVHKGYAVVPAIEREKALKYRDRAMEWLEAFPLGFDRHDIQTYKNENLPVNMKGGMIHAYGIAHEQWVWDVRTEQGVIDAFAKAWGTNELITSFDAAAVMLPKRTDVEDGGKWEHIDQSPFRSGFYVLQGIVNLNDNGPQDGGLMVLEGSSQLMEQYFNENGREGVLTWGPADYSIFWDELGRKGQEWFFERGCKWTKVCANPGDLILWDSRAMHFNVRPSGERDRTCTYVCMAPSKLLNETDRATRAEAFKKYRGTTHVPFASIFSRSHVPVLRNGKPDPLDTGIPQQPREATEKVLQLAGMAPY